MSQDELFCWQPKKWWDETGMAHNCINKMGIRTFIRKATIFNLPAQVGIWII